MAYGKAEYDPYLDEFECEICHRSFSGLSRHVYQAHKIKIKDYKKKFGLNQNFSLISTREREKRRELQKKIGFFKEFNKNNPHQFKKGDNRKQLYQRSQQSKNFLQTELPQMGVAKRKEFSRRIRLLTKRT